jgi:hypothetical protein
MYSVIILWDLKRIIEKNIEKTFLSPEEQLVGISLLMPLNKQK